MRHASWNYRRVPAHSSHQDQRGMTVQVPPWCWPGNVIPFGCIAVLSYRRGSPPPAATGRIPHRRPSRHGRTFLTD